MVIYVSDKDFDTCNEKIVTFNDVDLAVYDKKCGAYDIVETIERGAVIKSLEQHDAEIRKHAYAEGYQQGKFDTLADLEAEEHFNRLAEYENLGTVEEIEEILKLQEIRENRPFFKRYLKELRSGDKKTLYPDFDDIYKKYYELKEELETHKKLVEKLESVKKYLYKQNEFLNNEVPLLEGQYRYECGVNYELRKEVKQLEKELAELKAQQKLKELLEE